MVLNLVKKDFLLVKKNLLFMAAAAFGFPIYLSASIQAGFLIFLLTTLIIQYVLFSSVSAVEYKYKGSALLCATPYTRNALVIAKYVFNVAVFIGCYILYTGAALLFPGIVVMLDVSMFGMSLFIMTVVFGILIPAQYRFGYQKSKYIYMAFFFITPILLPVLAKWLQTNPVNLEIQLPFPHWIESLFPYLLAMLIGFISIRISINIYSREDL